MKKDKWTGISGGGREYGNHVFSQVPRESGPEMLGEGKGKENRKIEMAAIYRWIEYL